VSKSPAGPLFSWHRKRAIVVAILAVVLPIQAVYAFAVEPEPYPVIRLPGFGSAPDAGGKFARVGLEISILYSDGKILSPTPHELARPVRFSSARPTLDKAFRPLANGVGNPNASNDQVIAWLRRNASDLESSPPVEAVFCWRKQLVNIVDASVDRQGDCETVKVALS
jgi:hypothetical protein